MLRRWASSWGVRCVGTPRRWRSETSVSAISEAFAAFQPATGKLPDPMLFNVPTLCSHIVGRDQDIMRLWKQALQGSRVLVIQGVDGMGKSTVASEFCECAKQSKRFSCIHWFSSSNATPQEHFARFSRNMRGRSEKDVLLVFDNVQNPDDVIASVPLHNNLFILITTTRDVSSCAAYYVRPLGPVPVSAATQLVSAIECDVAPRLELFELLERVPLLMTLSSALIASEAVDVPTIATAVKAARAQQENDALSVSQVANLLVDFAIQDASQRHPNAAAMLATIACFQYDHMSTACLDAVYASYGGVDGSLLTARWMELGVLQCGWDNDVYYVHPVVAAGLRSRATSEAIMTSASTLLSLFPRRWRGLHSDVAMQLVHHARSILLIFQQRNIALTDDMFQCCDKAATICAHNEGRELPLALWFWNILRRYLQEGDAGVQDPNRMQQLYRITSECGKLSHHLRLPEAPAVLQDGITIATNLFGASSTEAALLTAILAPYLDDSAPSVAQMVSAEAVLKSNLVSTDEIRSKDEIRMLEESLAVLLYRRSQVEALKGDGTKNAWDELQRLKTRLMHPGQGQGPGSDKGTGNSRNATVRSSSFS